MDRLAEVGGERAYLLGEPPRAAPQSQHRVTLRGELAPKRDTDIPASGNQRLCHNQTGPAHIRSLGRILTR